MGLERVRTGLLDGMTLTLRRVGVVAQGILDGYGPWAGYALLYLRASG
ncbi:MAG: hypothetical protein ABI869_04770 [Actinomycetota bacterium]